jgi:NADP-dependent 3-hydroxy acid dehydrogenase YdfG
MGNPIEGKIAVITGASSGLGAATARYLAARGAIVVLGARRMERIEALADELKGNGAKALAKTTDVTDRAQVKALVDAAVETFGRVDVMLNNAGLMQQSQLERLKVDEWDSMVDINIKGVLYGIAAALPHMQRQKAGHVINVSSVAGHKVTPAGVVYSATKHAVRAITEGLRQEVRPYNIRTTVISPGAVATELPSHIMDKQSAAGIQKFYEGYAIPPTRSHAPSALPSSSPTMSTSTKSCSGPRGRNFKAARRGPSPLPRRFA